MKNISLIILLFCLLSCVEKDQKSIFDQKHPEFELKGVKLEYKEIIDPWKIDQKNSYLIIQEKDIIPEDQPLIYIIDKKTNEIVNSKGVIGFGPLEITDAHIFDPGNSEDTFWVNSVTAKKLSEFSLLDTSRLAINEFRQTEPMILAYKVYLTRNNTFLCLMADSPYKLVEFDSHGNFLKGHGKWEPIAKYKELDDYLLGTYNKGELKTNSKKDYFVKVSLYRDRIEIFDYNSKSFNIIDGPRMELPEVNISGTGSNASMGFRFDQIYGYRDVSITENFLFLLYSGYSQLEISQTGIEALTVYMMTTSGKLVAKFSLDIGIRSLAVDEKLGKIYGVTRDENPGIAVFDFPKHLLNNP
ncbi:TolB-like 6-bladed beta-propeller domain-containing protein [Belliella sp. R4-6]|uniref:TolB-like 6-bladed beta-propeller domain-containing protein n=1 Tax=Belliella alkalica TaxID=1730871 RepID=A0ABS9VAE4_9BACT|nr:BF3164 family lipoprotein [Belliella alkalica]MCH7413403.1 TolB-like 6-bladed beta-propeller domain-containing protein [Belliella alkalica]